MAKKKKKKQAVINISMRSSDPYPNDEFLVKGQIILPFEVWTRASDKEHAQLIGMEVATHLVPEWSSQEAGATGAIRLIKTLPFGISSSAEHVGAAGPEYLPWKKTRKAKPASC